MESREREARRSRRSHRPVRGTASFGLALAVLPCACISEWNRRLPRGNVEELPPISPNRPTFSDSPGLIPVGHAQLETGFTFTRRRESAIDGSRNQAPEAVARYRVNDALEARLLWGGYAWSESDDAATGTSREQGNTDVALAVLMPLAAQSAWLPELTLEVASTLGVGATAFGTGGADPTIKLLWGYSGGILPDWLGIGGNGIVAYPTEGGDRFTQPAASVFATFALPDSATSCFLEWYVVGRPANGVPATQSADGGVVHRLDARTAIDARVGFGLDSRADDFFTGAGISFFF